MYGIGADPSPSPATIDETVIEGEPAPDASLYEDMYESNLVRAMSAAGVIVGTYHGYKRNESIGWALVWGALGGVFPIFTIPIALAQGLGKKKGS